MILPRPATLAAALTLLTVFGGSAGTPAADAAKRSPVKLSTVNGFPVDISDAGLPENQYDVNNEDDPTAFCRNGKTPLTVGWRGANAPISGTNLILRGDTSYFSLDPRRPVKGGKLQAIAVCAMGRLKASYKAKSDVETIDCGKQLTLGLAASESGPYIETPVTIGPMGANGWSTEVGTQPRPSAVCVAKGAFKRVTTVSKTGTFAAGSASATVRASCSGGRRVVSWGYNAPVMAGNVWSSVESVGFNRSVPFVGDAVPTGKDKGWAITFRTADVKPAAADAPVTLTLRCAVPA